MNSNLKFKIVQIDNSWVNLILKAGSQEVILEASEITCSPIYGIIRGIEESCLYGKTAEVFFDAEGIAYKLELLPEGKMIRIRAFFVEIRQSIDMPGNTAFKEHLEYELSLPVEKALISFWRGLKEYFSTNNLNSGDISLIEAKANEFKEKRNHPTE